MRRPSSIILSAICLTGAASAAELGEVRVASHIGQPLVADIELTMVEDAAQPVGVRLADPEVYRGAGVAMPPVLAGTHFAVMRRDGRQFLHVTSLRPVDAEHLHLYVELADRGQRSVRLATLWLTPDPDPAPAPLLAPAPAPASATAPAPDPAPAAAASRTVAAAPATAAPRRPPAHAAPASFPVARQAVEPAACVRQAEAARACAALGEKNAALHAQLGTLEDRVKGLQTTLSGTPAPAAPAKAPEAAAEPTPKPAAPKPIGAIKPLVPCAGGRGWPPPWRRCRRTAPSARACSRARRRASRHVSAGAGRRARRPSSTANAFKFRLTRSHPFGATFALYLTFSATGNGA
jgi:hypothetical protein